MNEINEPISVIFVYNAHKRYAKPYKIQWKGRDYVVQKINLHYAQEKDGTYHHTYILQAENTVMQVVLNTRTLFWELQKVGTLDN